MPLTKPGNNAFEEAATLALQTDPRVDDSRLFLDTKDGGEVLAAVGRRRMTLRVEVSPWEVNLPPSGSARVSPRMHS